MSLTANTPHAYQPLADASSSTIRIDKRITAKPTPFPFPTPANQQFSQPPRCEPFIVRLALKTSYFVSVPNYMTIEAGSRLSALEMTERSKQVIRHTDILCSQTGRMKLRVGCVVDGNETQNETVQQAFVAGVRGNLKAIGLSSMTETSNDSDSVQEYELSPLHPFLPKHAKDTTKPSCFLERIEVSLVWRTETVAVTKKRKRNPRKGKSATQLGEVVADSSAQQVAQAGTIIDRQAMTAHLLSASSSTIPPVLMQMIENVKDRLLIHGMATMFPLIFKPRMLQHMQNDVVGLDSIAESCRKIFQQTQNKVFKREGKRIYTAMTYALSQLTATRRCILGNSDTVEISEGATQADASEFESVIASAMMQLTKALENGLRIKIEPASPLSEVPVSNSAASTDQTLAGETTVNIPKETLDITLPFLQQDVSLHDGLLETGSRHKQIASPQDSPQKYIDKWNPNNIQRLRETLAVRERRASIIDSDGAGSSTEEEAWPYRKDVAACEGRKPLNGSWAAESIISETHSLQQSFQEDKSPRGSHSHLYSQPYRVPSDQTRRMYAASIVISDGQSEIDSASEHSQAEQMITEDGEVLFTLSGSMAVDIDVRSKGNPHFSRETTSQKLEETVRQKQDPKSWGERTLRSFIFPPVGDTYGIAQPRGPDPSRMPRASSIIDISDEESGRFRHEKRVQQDQEGQVDKFNSQAAESHCSIAKCRTADMRRSSELNRGFMTDATRGRQSFESIISD